MYPQTNAVRSVRNLSGVWDFRFNANEPWQPIAVPASYNDQSPDPEFRRHYGMAYYRTTFTVPEGARRVLRFDAVTHNAVVRLNGQEIVTHRGGFLPFEADITALAKPGDTILAMNLNNGGHLTHGSPVNFSGKLFHMEFYGVDENGFIDYEDVRRKARECRPQLILAGASAYSRIIDFPAFADAAREAGAYFMVDMAHIAGLVAAGDHPSPFGLADIITTTTHKTLRGTRSGLIFCRPELAKRVDSAVFPGCQGGALQHVIAGKAVTAEEASTEEFREYIHAVVRNCKAMCDEFISMGYKVVTGGTDNHLFLLDLTDTGLTGKAVQDELDRHGITLNKNCVPNESRSPQQTSGVRIGTAAMTTKGYTEQDFIAVARQIDRIIRDMQDMRKE